MPARLPITDEERRERKRQQDHNAHIRRMEGCGLKARGSVVEIIGARDIRRARFASHQVEEHTCA